MDSGLYTMDRRFALYVFLIAPLLIITVLGASALSCDKETLSFRVDAGNWAYGEIKCSDAIDVDADYTGNLSDKTRILVAQDGDIFKIGMLTDARNAEQGTYRGKLIITDDSGRERKIDTRLRVGEGSEEGIILSKEAVTFEIDSANKTECYTVDVNNSGNVELNNIKAEFTTADLTFFHNNNVSHPNWITMSEINDTELATGKTKHLEICVNTYTDHLNLKNRETEIAITADGLRSGSVKEEIKVTLLVDYDSEWQKKYNTLLEQHQFLEKAYSRERNYRYAYEALNKTYGGLVENYTSLEAFLNNSNLTYSINKTQYLGNITNNSSINETKNITAKEQKTPANETLRNPNNQTAATSTTSPITPNVENADTSSDEKFLEQLKKNKEAQNKTTGGNTTSRESARGMSILGYVVNVDPSMTPYIAGGLLLVVIFIIGTSMSFGKQIKKGVNLAGLGKKPGMKKVKDASGKTTVINAQTPHDTTGLVPLKLEGSRDDQKEELKRILLNRLLEEKTLRKSI